MPPAALPGAKLLKKFDQNFLLPFGRFGKASLIGRIDLHFLVPGL